MTTFNKTVPDELNPNFIYSNTSTDLLCNIAEKTIDPEKLARKELANRGLTPNGKWVGFTEAENLYTTWCTAKDEAFEIAVEQEYQYAQDKLADLNNELVTAEPIHSLESIHNVFVEVIAEYLHGSADVEDCGGVNIIQYIAVAHDLLLSLENVLGPLSDDLMASDDPVDSHYGVNTDAMKAELTGDDIPDDVRLMAGDKELGK